MKLTIFHIASRFFRCNEKKEEIQNNTPLDFFSQIKMKQ